MVMVFFVSSAFARANYEVVEALTGDVNAFPLLKSLVVEKLGPPDSVETMTGFPYPTEIYAVDGSDELSHVYFVYNLEESGEPTYAVGVVMKEEMGMNVANTLSEAEKAGMGSVVVLHGSTFAIFDLFAGMTKEPLWVIVEDREFQGETVFSSTLISPKNTLPYIEGTYGEEARKLLEKAMEGRTQ